MAVVVHLHQLLPVAQVGLAGVGILAVMVINLELVMTQIIAIAQPTNHQNNRAVLQLVVQAGPVGHGILAAPDINLELVTIQITAG